jgi:hypothetical protein
MTFPENSQLTVVSSVAGVTAVTIVVIPAVVGIRDVPHVSADVVQPVVVSAIACILTAADISTVSVVTVTAGVPAVT